MVPCFLRCHAWYHVPLCVLKWYRIRLCRLKFHVPIQQILWSQASGESPEDETEAEAGALVTSNNNERKKSDRAAAADEIDLFEFDFPSDLCGMLIGNKGKNIKRLMESSGAKVTVRKKPYSPSLQVIAVQGFPNQISHVMHQIRQRFPPRRYGISYAPSVPEKPMLSPEIMQVRDTSCSD